MARERPPPVSTFHNGCDRSDFHFIKKSLYRTEKGTWFLAGEGGALTSFSKPIGNNGRTGGTDLHPVTEKEAQDVLEEWDDISALEYYFGAGLEDA